MTDLLFEIKMQTGEAIPWNPIKNPKDKPY